MQKIEFSFTNEWFERDAKPVWDELLPKLNPSRILEIGSYEGASTCYLIQKIGAEQDMVIHCVDTWEGGVEHQEGGVVASVMSEVEQRFLQNTQAAQQSVPNKVSLVIHKNSSLEALSKLLADGKSGYFDFIYVDGSHQAPDVMADAVLGFALLRKGGILAFDDYLWQEKLPGGADLIRSPKIAIDAFTNIYCRKIRILRSPNYQLYVRKTSD